MSIIREIDKENHKEGEDKLESKVKKSFHKSQLYGQDKNKFIIVKSIVLTLFDVIFLLSGFLPYVYDLSKKLSVVRMFTMTLELLPLRVKRDRNNDLFYDSHLHLRAVTTTSLENLFHLCH